MNFTDVFPEIISKSYSGYKKFLFEGIHFPMVELNSFFFENKIISLPFIDRIFFHNDILGRNLENFYDFLKKSGEKFEIRTSSFDKNFDKVSKVLIQTDFTRSENKGHIVSELTNEKDYWERFHKHTRNEIRKAEKSNLIIKKIDSEEELKQFYNLYSRQMKNFGTPQHSLKFFRNCRKIMESSFFGLNCYKDNKIIGSIILFFEGDYAYVAFNVSNPEFRILKPNEFIYWGSIKECFKRKIKFLDIGQIDLNPSQNSRENNLLKFKRKWLGKEYKKYIFTLNSKMESTKRNSLKKFRKIWKKIPLPILKLISPKIIVWSGL